MKKYLLIIFLLCIPISAGAWGIGLIGGGTVAGEPPAGIAVTNLASGISATEIITIACNTETPTGMVLISTACAYGSLPAEEAVTIAGCGLSWGQLDLQAYGGRRFLAISKGTGTWSAVGNLTIECEDDGEETFNDSIYSIDEVTGSDETNDAVVKMAGTASGENLGDVGTPGTGDVVFSAFTDEDAEDTIALTSGITQLSKNDTAGYNVRALIVGWDNDPADETPGFTSNTSGGYAGMGFIINVP